MRPTNVFYPLVKRNHHWVLRIYLILGLSKVTRPMKAHQLQTSSYWLHSFAIIPFLAQSPQTAQQKDISSKTTIATFIFQNIFKRKALTFLQEGHLIQQSMPTPTLHIASNPHLVLSANLCIPLPPMYTWLHILKSCCEINEILFINSTCVPCTTEDVSMCLEITLVRRSDFLLLKIAWAVSHIS